MRILPQWLRDGLKTSDDSTLIGAVLLYVFSLPFHRIVPVPSMRTLRLSDLLLAGVWALFALRVVTRKRAVRLTAPFWAALIYMGALAISLAQPTAHLSGAVKLVAYGSFMMLPFLLPHIVTKKDTLIVIMRTWMVATVIAIGIGIVGIVAYYVDHDGLGTAMMCGYGGLSQNDIHFPRVCSPFTNQNMFLNYLIPGICFWAIHGVAWVGRARTLFVLFAAIPVVLSTMSTGVGGLAIALAIILIRRDPMAFMGPPLQRLKALGVALAAAVMALFLTLASVCTWAPVGQGHLTVGSRDVVFWDGPRPAIWNVAAKTVRDNPIRGRGYSEMVAHVFDPRAFTSPDKIASLPPNASSWLEGHNSWLNILGQAGLVGLTGFLILLAVLLRPLFDKGLRARLPQELQGLPTTFSAILIGMFGFHALFGALEESRHLWPVFGLVSVLPVLCTTDARQPTTDDQA